MAILNMVWAGSSWGANLWAPTDLYVGISWTTASITRKDPDLIWTIPPTWFSKSVLVRKIGSAPTSPTDWTVVVEETTRNTYETTPYEDMWLTIWVDYHYRVFTISTTWGISYSESVVTSWHKTYTISRTEQSDMSSWWTYSDDAEWLVAWDTAFDEFFWYSAVRLASDWTEVDSVTQAQSWWAWKLDITQLWTLTSGDNVMIKLPVRWIRMTKDGSNVTLSITDWLGRESEWFQYYAFQKTWDVDANANTTVATHPLYLGTYLSTNSSNTLKSLSWQWIYADTNIGNFLTYSQNNWTWWNLMWWYQRNLINAYYMMKYGNPDGRSVVGRWNADSRWGSRTWTWGTNSQINATYWTSNTDQMKLFWLEDRWGNSTEFIWWAFVDASNGMRVALHDFISSIDTSDVNYKYVWKVSTGSWNGWWWLSQVGWDNKLMFWKTYWCGWIGIYYHDVCEWGSNSFFGAGAHYAIAGCMFYLGNQGWYMWSRLMYL